MKRLRTSPEESSDEWFLCEEHPEWIFRKPYLGMGTRAAVYTTCKASTKDCAFVAKFYMFGEHYDWESEEPEVEYQREVDAYTMLNKGNRITSYMYDYFTCSFSDYDAEHEYGIIILDKLGDTGYEIVRNDPMRAKDVFDDYVRLVQDLLITYRITQGDTHAGNIAYRDGKPYLFDFGSAEFNVTSPGVPGLRAFMEMGENLGLTKDKVSSILLKYFPKDDRIGNPLKCFVCLDTAKYLCGQCKDQFYCSEECAQKDWITRHFSRCVPGRI